MKNIGRKFGDREIIACAEPALYFNKKRNIVISSKAYLCRCKCGYESVIIFSVLKGGLRKSCKSCMRAESASKLRVGSKINSWTIKKDLGLNVINGCKVRRYLIECECGARLEKNRFAVESLGNMSCLECYRKKIGKIASEGSHSDIKIGDVFGAWTVIDFVLLPSGKESKGYWICACKCGTVKEIKGWSLRHADTTRCLKCFLKLSRRNKLNKADNAQ